MLNELRAIMESVASANDTNEALNCLVRQTCIAMSVECCTVFVADHEQHELVMKASEGLSMPVSGDFRINWDVGVVGLVAQRAEPINLANAQDHSSFRLFPEIKEQDYRAFLGTPIIHQKRLLGVLVVQQKDSREFDESEESFLVTLAAQIATVIAHAEAIGKLWDTNSQSLTLQGVPSSPGISVARAWLMMPDIHLADIPDIAVQEIGREHREFEQAWQNCLNEIDNMALRLRDQLNRDSLAIFDIYRHLLVDPGYSGEIRHQIDQGWSAKTALRMITQQSASQFEAMSDPYLRERSADIFDLGQRLLKHLSRQVNYAEIISEPVILVADEVSATMLAEIPRKQLKGLVSMRGASNSHAAILARALGVPSVMGVESIQEIHRGDTLIVDGYRGQVLLNPLKAVLYEYHRLETEEKEMEQMVTSELAAPAETADGEPVQLLLNAGLSADLDIAFNVGADGVGLYRTEVPFLLQQCFPSEEEQAERYAHILRVYSSKPVVMRTLDVGGDKQLPYYPVIEDNPFLGWRGLRFTLDHPDIFLIQLRAMLKANLGNQNLEVMLPMVTDIYELDEAILLFDQACAEIEVWSQQRSFKFVRPRFGVMLEVPSLLYQLPTLAGKVDFISIGTNDLTQYLLAVDRNNAKVAKLFSSVHPAVLRALKQVIQEIEPLHLDVSICGELAGDPIGSLLLVGMGYRQLSMNTYNIARVKYLLRHISLDEMKALAEAALVAQRASEVRHLGLTLLEQHALAGLIRPGK